MFKLILDYRNVIIFYGLIVITIIGLNARLSSLNELNQKESIDTNQNILAVEN